TGAVIYCRQPAYFLQQRANLQLYWWAGNIFSANCAAANCCTRACVTGHLWPGVIRFRCRPQNVTPLINTCLLIKCPVFRGFFMAAGFTLLGRCVASLFREIYTTAAFYKSSYLFYSAR